MRPTGNTTLVEHGIQTELSDIRAHICPRERRVYIFPTQAGIEAIDSQRYVVKEAHQEGTDVITARGCWVPPMEIRRCISLAFRDSAWNKLQFRDGDSLSEKGSKALKLVLGIIRAGLFPGSLSGEKVQDLAWDIRGMDIIIRARHMPERIVQVKCDYAGGRSGLFLQLEECNPLGRH